MEHFEAAIDRIIGGLEKKNRVFIFLSYCIFLLFSFSIYFSHILHILFVYFQLQSMLFVTPFPSVKSDFVPLFHIYCSLDALIWSVRVLIYSVFTYQKKNMV